MASTREMAAALRSIAEPGMKPKALRTAIRKRYPDARKKEIVRAALFAVVEAASPDRDETLQRHDSTLTERIAADNADEVLHVGKKKKKRSSEDRDGPLVH